MLTLRYSFVLLILAIAWNPSKQIVRGQATSSSDPKKKKSYPSFSSIWELVSWYSKSYDIDGLHGHLQALFGQSERQFNPARRAEALLPDLQKRSGYEVTTRHKLVHDLEQCAYILNYPGLSMTPRTKELFGWEIPQAYAKILAKFDKGEADHEDYYYLDPDQRSEDKKFLEFYNRAIATPPYEATIREKEYGNQLQYPLLDLDTDFRKVQKQWMGQDPDHEYGPGVVVIDDLLSPKALNKVRELMMLSTIWYEAKHPKFGNYVGAYIGDGLHQKLLLAIAFELHKAMPQIMRGHPLKYMWAYKYESNSTSENTGVHTHADDAAINVNIWLTPTDANLDPTSGGLVVFTAKPPANWTFTQFNSNWEYVEENLLKPTNFANFTIPYRQNRAVLFDSFLFHKTDDFRFKPGYENRRINLTLLYGKRQNQPLPQQTSRSEEL